jgi:hypothetical protein
MYYIHPPTVTELETPEFHPRQGREIISSRLRRYPQL